MEKIDRQHVVFSNQGLQVEVGKKIGALPNPHVHEDTYQIELFISGQAVDLAHPSYGDFLPGTWVIYEPTFKHQLLYQNTQSIIFHIDSPTINKLNAEIGEFGFKVKISPYPQKIRSLSYDILHHEMLTLEALAVTFQQDKALNLYTENKVYSLLKIIFMDQKTQDFSQAQMKSNLRIQSKMRTIEHYIKANYQDSALDVKTLARVVHMSEFHFAHSFQKHFLQSPYEYLIEVRTNAAYYKMVTKSFENLEQLSREVGLNSAAQLRYHFKKLFKKLPSKIIGS